MKHSGRGFLAGLSGILFATTLAATAAAQTTVLFDDFEDGTLQGWIPRGGTVVLTNTEEVGSRTGGAGTHSLETTGRTAGYNGPSLDTLGLLTKGATCQVSVWVRLLSGESPTQLKVTMQRTVNGSSSYDTIAQSASTGVTDAGWTQLTGLYAFGGTDPTGLLLYVEAASATASYYIDDFRIDKIADPPGPPPNTDGLTSTFESATNEGWASRTGGETVAVSSADAHGGSFSLLTGNRSATYQGPNLDVTNVMFNGSRYKVSLWAKLAPGEEPAQLRVSLQRNAGTVTTYHTVIGDTNVTADAWVRLTTTYDVALANSSLFLYVESSSSLASFYIDDVQLTYLPPPTIEPDLPSVYESLADYFPVGAAVRNAAITGVHGDLLKKHFNSITSENDMKWDATEPSEGSFNFANADQQVAFARANGMLVRGHTLVWHSQVPAWVFTDPLTGTTMLPTPANHDLLLQRLANHVRGVVSHFGDKVYAWDVANEVIDESQPDCMRRSTWYTVTGADYIDTAFRTAREVAPDALLFINDYNTTIPAKRTCLYDLVRDLQARGVPIDGVGHQMHDNIEFPQPQDMADTLDLFAQLGVTQHVTEMDVSIYSGSDNTSIPNYDEIPEERFVRQGYHYRDLFQVFRQHKDQLTSVTLWGLADDATWRTSSGRVDAPLLFDDQLQHKLAYTGVVNPLDLPGADLAVSSSADAATVLSGREITYTATVTNNGHDGALNVTFTDALPTGAAFRSITAPAGWTCTTPPVGSGGSIGCGAPSLDAGDAVVFVVVVDVPCATASGTLFTNAVAVSSTTLDPNPEPNNAAWSTVSVSNPPPVIEHLHVRPSFLFPPDGRLRNVFLFYRVSDNCDAGFAPVVTVASSDPVTGRGDHTSPDWIVVSPHLVKLRAEGVRHFDPRLYTITVTAADSAGATGSDRVTVKVLAAHPAPHHHR